MLGLELHRVSRSFGGYQVLHDIDLAVSRGEIVGLIGAHGAGKTTTLRLILGLLAPSEGTIAWDGHPLTDQHRPAIGYLPDEPGLYLDMTVAEQLIHFGLLEGYSLAGARSIAHDLLETFGLTGQARTRVQELSAEHQQYVQLAISLLPDPEMLVLDEPFAGLDLPAAQAMVDHIRRQADRGVGILFSTHQLEIVESVCDRVCVLEQGQIVISGEVNELKTDPYSRWVLTFAEEISEICVAELSIIPGLLPTPIDGDPTSIMVTIAGHDRSLPEEVLQVAIRCGGLLQIRHVKRSLAEKLTERLATSPPTVTDDLSDVEFLGTRGAA